MDKNKFCVFLLLLTLAGSLPGAAEPRLLWKQDLVVETAGGPAIFSDRAAVVNKNGALFVFDHRGQLLWQRDLKAPLAAAPSYDGQGKLWLADLFGQLRSLDEQGQERLVLKGSKPFRATPLPDNGRIVVCDEEGQLSMFDAGSGQLLRSVSLGAPVFSSGLVLDDGSVLQPSKDGKVFKIFADGKVRTWFSGSGVIFSSPAAFGDGRIALTSMDHHLYLLDADGKAQFRFRAQRWVIASPVIDQGGRIYFGSYDKHFYAVEANGKMAWRVDGQGGFNACPVIDDSGVVYTGDGSGRIYAFSRNGRSLWQFRSGDYVRSALALFPDRAVLLVASLDGFLYALQAEAPLARDARWPKYMGDERNSGRTGRR